MENLTSHTGPGSSRWKIPRDGAWRYLYDIWQPLTFLLLTTCFTAAFYSTYNPQVTQNADDLFFCNADGNVEKSEPEYQSLWDPNLYFTVNIAFGRFAFSTVKVIDAGWDAVVGRGGQMLAAVLAYRTLRRSLTLTMETCTVTLPTVATIYCHQIQLVSLGKLTQDIFSHRTSTHPKRQRPIYLGKLRLGVQILICGYVLLFATFVSVMSGYRAQLTGYFGYDPESASQLQPVSGISQPRMVVFNGSRIGLSDSPIYALEKIPITLDESGSSYNISEFIHSSRDFEEPFGVLVDYYFTCLGVIEGVIQGAILGRTSNATQYNLECSRHECSCSARDVHLPRDDNIRTLADYERFKSTRGPEIFANITSNITVAGQLWELPAPPLSIGLAGSVTGQIGVQSISTTMTSIDYWAENEQDESQPIFSGNNRFGILNTVYWNNGTAFDEATIKRTGRCISEDAYSWGFSSLLLLTFCCSTIAFAIALILLQTDVYWNSRHDRFHQTHSIYTDVLYLAEELKASFGGDVKDDVQSPKTFGKEVERQKQALRLEVDGLPLSRWQDWISTRAAKAATHKGRAAPEYTDSLAHELRRLSSRDGDQLAAPTTEYKAPTSMVRSESQLEAAEVQANALRSESETCDLRLSTIFPSVLQSRSEDFVANVAPEGVCAGVRRTDGRANMSSNE